MKEEKKKEQEPQSKKNSLREDDGKRTPPGPTGYVTGGKHHASRPEQGPDVPPQDRTEGIP